MACLSWWWEPLPLEMISTPLRARAMCGAWGVNSSSHVSAASAVSFRDRIRSPEHTHRHTDVTLVCDVCVTSDA